MTPKKKAARQGGPLENPTPSKVRPARLSRKPASAAWQSAATLLRDLGRSFDKLPAADSRARLAEIGALVGVKLRTRGVLAPAPAHSAAVGVGLGSCCPCTRCVELRGPAERRPAKGGSK